MTTEIITENSMAAQGCAAGCVYRVSMRGGTPISVRICMLCHRIDFDDLAQQARELVQRATMPEHLRGDGPCKDCGNEDNIRWFTESVFWNQVIGGPGAMGDPGGILCVPCFVKRADAAGYAPRAWRLLPEWHWETVQERADRRAREVAAVPSETPETEGVDHEQAQGCAHRS